MNFQSYHEDSGFMEFRIPRGTYMCVHIYIYIYIYNMYLYYKMYIYVI